MFKNGFNLIKLRKKRYKQSMMILCPSITIQKTLDKLNRIKIQGNGRMLRIRNL